jgi:hypothetical protein
MVSYSERPLLKLGLDFRKGLDLGVSISQLMFKNEQ